MLSFQNLFLTVLTTFAVTISPVLLAEVKLQTPSPKGEICVETNGFGATKQDALQAAMKKAIESAVRIYTTTSSESKNNSHKREITTSNARITNYKTMLSLHHKGLWTVRIKANVFFGDSSNQTKKLIISKTSSDDIGHFANTTPKIKGEVSVEGVGHGTTRQEALQDAMRKVVEHAVGMYVTTRSELTDGSYKEKIIINSDAVITDYKETQAFKDGDTWTIKIIARVLPNDSLKNMQKTTTQKISSTDRGNLVNKINSLKQANEAISEIFRDYYPRIIKFKKQGNLRVDQTSDINSSDIRIKVDFVAYIDQNEFNIFQKRLCILLDKFALQKEVRYVSKGISETLGKQMLERAGLKEFNLGNNDVCFIVFQKHQKKDTIYTIYLLPSKIRQFIEKRIYSNTAYIVCSLFLMGELVSHKTIFHPNYLEFYSNDFREVCKPISFYPWLSYIYVPLTFFNKMYISSEHKDLKIENSCRNKELNGTITLSIPMDYVKRLEKIYIFPVEVAADIQNKEKIEKAAIETEKLLWHKN